MKKLINISLIALTFAFIGPVDAKIMKRRTSPSTTVSVTKNEKQMFVDTKALKNASSAQEKVAAAVKLASDIKNNPNARLVLEEQVLRAEIKELEEKIAQEESYISYLDTEEVTTNKKQLEELYAELAEVETKLNKTITNRPQAVSYLNYWSVRTLIGVVGIALAYKLGAGKVLMTAGSAAWDYVPSGSKAWQAAKTNFGYGGSIAWTGLTLLQIRDFINRISYELSEEQNKPHPDQQRLDNLEKQLAELKAAEQQRSQDQ